MKIIVYEGYVSSYNTQRICLVNCRLLFLYIQNFVALCTLAMMLCGHSRTPIFFFVVFETWKQFIHMESSHEGRIMVPFFLLS